MEAYVVGGGPVGLFAAACLEERGVEVAVVDAEWARPVRSYACGLHPETLRLFDRLGLLPALQEAGHRVDRLIISRATERVAALDLGDGARFPYVLTLPQSDLHDLLTRELERLEIPVCARQEVTKLIQNDGSVAIEVVAKAAPFRGEPETEREAQDEGPLARRAEYVIAADGYDSRCRQAAGLELIDLQRPEVFVIFEFEAELGEFAREAHLITSEDEVSAFWPLGPQRGRWTLQLHEHLDEAPSMGLLTELLQRRAPWFRPRPEQLAWSTIAHFERRIVRHFGAGRVWLAGDSAHVTSPLGFQNMNRGFVEASELADVISGKLQGAPAAAGGLERFERTQQTEWRRLLGLGVRVVSQGRLSAVEGAQLVPCLPASGRDLDALLGQLELRIVPTWGSVRPSA
ncbi:MAG TPA: NAD(P)/FAD-dependent oxidoreductase [Polyangiaceae bacterium]|nr:NAD(P)/FAD-dependent oxidoreductase [Polyangiaceae bacterium]